MTWLLLAASSPNYHIRPIKFHNITKNGKNKLYCVNLCNMPKRRKKLHFFVQNDDKFAGKINHPFTPQYPKCVTLIYAFFLFQRFCLEKPFCMQKKRSKYGKYKLLIQCKQRRKKKQDGQGGENESAARTEKREKRQYCRRILAIPMLDNL